MSKVKIQGNASGTGVVTLTAPNTNTDRTITLPDETVSLTGAPAGLDDVGGVARATSGLLFNGDTAAANALDDYEEGTWTPTVSGSTTAGSYTLSTSSRKYTKIGRQVTIECNINYINTSGAGSGHLTIGGLPFGVSGSQIGNVQANSGLDFPTNTVPTWYLTGASSHFRCNRTNKGSMFQILVPTANTGFIYLRLTATYQTD